MINGVYEGIYEMPEHFKKRLWPNLDTYNHRLKSNPTEIYNCVSWANHINFKSVDLSLDENGEPLLFPDLSSSMYVEYFQNEGFELCETSNYEEGYEKIALYEKSDKTFEHVARQLSDGIWTSKLGEWEDIEHTTLDALQSPGYYGFPRWFMKRKIR